MRTYINCRALLPIVVIITIIMLYILKTVCLWLKPLTVINSKIYEYKLIDHPEHGI